MKHRRWQPLGITSTKKPFNTHLWWEHITYGLVLVDSADQAKLFISRDKGTTWLEIDLSDNTNSYKIQAGWLDGNDLWLVSCDNDGTADDFEVFFIELDDFNDCNPIGVSAGADVNSVFAYDIFKIGTDMFVINRQTPGPRFHVWEVDTAPFVDQDSESPADFSGGDIWYGVVVGTKYHTMGEYAVGGGQINYIHYEDSTTTLTIEIGTELSAYSNPERTQMGISYDGSDIITFVGNKDAGGLDFLVSYSIGSDAFVVNDVFNVALMIDRNNSGTVPNELEKGFGMANEIVYEIKPRRGGIVQLQDISDISDNNIIAITDNFLMNDDGDMFEWVDVVDEITITRYKNSIMGIGKKIGHFKVHPLFQANWSIGDSIKWYDNDDLLEFWGKILEKNQEQGGLYNYKIYSFTNEVFDVPYEKTYSADDLDTKQKDIIDNALDFCYRSSSIVGTTTTFNYAYNRVVVYLFFLGRRLERQVPYIDSDGKIWTKAHDGLIATGKSWDINDNNQIAFLVDIPGIGEKVEGYFEGNTGITRNTVRYKDNATAIRPIEATRDPIEQLKGVSTLKEYRDSKIEASTEAEQLGDNRYAIWSADTKFLGLRTKGQGFLQPGKTIEIQNTGQVTIAQDDFLIISYVRDPLNDVYRLMILSDNIITPQEFTNLDDTSRQQISTGVVQAFENQADINAQHNRMLVPLLFNPQHGYTAGANNVYWVQNHIRFGVTSKTVGATLFTSFRLPEDYVSGENMTLELYVRLAGVGGNPDVIDFKVAFVEVTDGGGFSTKQTTDSTWSEDWSGQIFYKETVIESSGAFNAGDLMRIDVDMEDDDNGLNTECLSVNLIIPVNSRD